MALLFSQLEEARFEEAYSVLYEVGNWVKQMGRRQRISKTTIDTYQQWQSAGANFVVSEEGAIVGLVSLVREPLLEWSDFVSEVPVPMIRGLATRPSCRGKSVGAFAISSAIELLKEEAEVYLDCVSGFLPQYYSKFGFEAIDTQIRQYDDEPDPYDITLMRLTQNRA